MSDVFLLQFAFQGDHGGYSVLKDQWATLALRAAIVLPSEIGLYHIDSSRQPLFFASRFRSALISLMQFKCHPIQPILMHRVRLFPQSFRAVRQIIVPME